MRSLLDWTYRACGVVAAVSLALIALLVLAQIAGRLFGVLVPGADDLAGFALIASSFLALPYTLRAGGHIRVVLLLQRLNPTPRRMFELWCLAVGALVIGYFSYYAIDLTWGSYRFGDMSQGILPIPLWLPQSGMALGLIVLSISFLDELVRVLRGDVPTYESDSELLERDAATDDGPPGAGPGPDAL